MDGRESRSLRALAWVQGIFYILTGVWPLVSMETFLAVTGPKVDLWLVRTVGILIAVIGVTLLLAARRRRIGSEIIVLAAGSAAGLAGIDLVYALGDRISDIYLLDALVEIALALAWVGAWVAARRA
jgi:NAD(P)H-dependent flavin oxidoreductase YrpB (nitropropane dioxygenase family)